MAEPFAPYAGLEGAALTGGEGGDVLQKLLLGVLQGTAQIPKHVIDAAAQTAPPGLRREDYTDAPAPQGTAAFGLSPQAWQPGDEQRAQSVGAAAGLAGVGTSFAVPGAIGIFGGRLAATADKAKLARAEEMAAAGADRKAIWDETGWFKGGDDKWRFEIPDYKSQMNQGWHDNGVPNADLAPIAGQLWHKPLYDAYPDLRKITGMTEKATNASGSYRPEHGFSGETINIQAPNAPAARSVALHEMQHAVQEREGFARGGSPSMFTQGDDAQLAREALAYRRELADLDPHLTPKQKDKIVRKRYEDAGAPDWFPKSAARDIAHDVEGNPAETLDRVMQLYGTDQSVKGFKPQQLYRELPGEIEARNVQWRKDIPPEMLRERPPWETTDIDPRPIMNQIFGGGRVGALEGGRSAGLVQESAPAGFRAYHGSPHDFDKFSLDKIGTGEGNQAFGHGLYFAENEGVARNYRAMNAPPGQGGGAARLANDALKMAEDTGLTGDAAKRFAMEYLTNQAPKVNALPPQHYYDAVNNFEALTTGKGAHGRMYEVNIKADPAHFLDWDTPLSGQSPKVKEALTAFLDERYGAGFFKKYSGGGNDVKDILNHFDDLSAADISKALRDRGVPGIKYLDAGSRSDRSGSRNYVAFDDALVDIVKKYGVAGAAPVGALMVGRGGKDGS